MATPLRHSTHHMALQDAYLPAANSYDEMRQSDGSVRPHWQYVLDALRALGVNGIETRWREARRLVRDNGVTYNVYGDTRGISRPWELDPLPLLLRGEEWAALERGLIQRAELLNQILRDLYGPRQLITSGILPPELIDNYPGYLLPCHGVEATAQRPLILCGVDLTRDPQGRWQVIGDRAQSPAGAGYALENRVVLSRVMPSLFRDSHVHRLAGFFRSVRRALWRLAPRRDEDARSAVLTPGPSNEAYFEHAYLANYLGYSLVQGGDLSVRDGALWLRTLGRLERINVLLRRVDDVWCDPLELREDSLLGVPGLMQAVRAGNLTLANALGSGVLEHPGLMAFLPQLCRQLLGEELLLPQLRTWWCGHAADRAFVIDHLSQLVIKPAGNPAGQRCVFGKQLNTTERDALITAIQTTPARFVAQEEVQLSTAPAYLHGCIEPRPFVLRSFLVWEEGGYAVMPGGLSRVALDCATPVVSNQLGGLGKDTWVLASEPERQETLLINPDRAAPVVIHESAVSSRVADDLFWIGRYAERAEGLVRLLRVTLINLSERYEMTPEQPLCCIQALLRALNPQRVMCLQVCAAGRQLWPQPANELMALLADGERIGGLPQTLQALIQAAWSVRERLSNDIWRIVNDIEQRVRTLTQPPPPLLNNALDTLDPLITALAAFAALTHENMTHNEGWHFLETGRRLERAINSATLLRATLVTVTSEWEENRLIEAVLGVTDSLMTYRRRYRAGTRVGALLDLVLQDETNPRSLAYQIVQLQRLLDDMPRTAGISGRSHAQKTMMHLVTTVRLAELDALVQTDIDGQQRPTLAALLEQIETHMATVSDALTAQYFRHEEQPHHLITARQHRVHCRIETPK